MWDTSQLLNYKSETRIEKPRKMFDQIKTEPLQFISSLPAAVYQQQLTNVSHMTQQQQQQVTAAILQHANQLHSSNMHQQPTVITVHENKNRPQAKMSIVSRISHTFICNF